MRIIRRRVRAWVAAIVLFVAVVMGTATVYAVD